MSRSIFCAGSFTQKDQSQKKIQVDVFTLHFPRKICIYIGHWTANNDEYEYELHIRCIFLSIHMKRFHTIFPHSFSTGINNGKKSVGKQ